MVLRNLQLSIGLRIFMRATEELHTWEGDANSKTGTFTNQLVKSHHLRDEKTEQAKPGARPRPRSQGSGSQPSSTNCHWHTRHSGGMSKIPTQNRGREVASATGAELKAQRG